MGAVVKQGRTQGGMLQATEVLERPLSNRARAFAQEECKLLWRFGLSPTVPTLEEQDKRAESSAVAHKTRHYISRASQGASVDIFDEIVASEGAVREPPRDLRLEPSNDGRG